MADNYDGSIRIDTKLDIKGFERGSEKLLKAIDSLSNSVGNIGKNFTTDQMASKCLSLERSVMGLHDRLMRLGTAAAQGFSNQGQVARFEDNVEIISHKIAELRSKLEALGSTTVQSEEFKTYTELLEEATQSYNRLIESQERLESVGVSQESETFIQLQEQIQRTVQRMEEYKKKLEELKASGRGVMSGMDTEEYRMTEQTIQDLESRLLEVKAAGNEAAASVNRFGAGNVILKLVTGTVREMGSVLRKVGSKGFQLITNSLRGMRVNTLNVNNAVKALTQSLTSLKTMMLSKAKSAFISLLTKDIGEGIQALARYSTAFNQTMSNIKNAGTQVSGNIAAVFGNLITVLEPIITRIISLINTALTAINALFAAFRGKTAVTVAKKGMDSYAKSTGGAAKEQKKLNAELYGWDELTRQNKNEDAAGGGGGAAGGGIQYEDIPLDDLLPQKIRDWINKIKDAFNQGDWYGIGELIADGLNAALKKVDDWINNTLRPNGVKWAERIAQILNGLTDKFDWRLLGKTISDGLAAVFDIAATFLETYNFANLGKGFANAIDAIFKNKDMWDQAARFFSGMFNAAIDTAWGFIKESLPHMFDWGATIGAALIDMLSNIHWDKLSETIVKGVDGVIKFLKGFISDEARWKEIGGKIAESFNKTVKEIDLGELGSTLSDLLMKFLDWLGTLDWKTLGEKVGEMLGNIDWPGILAKVGKIVVDALGGAIKGFLEGDHGWSTALMLAAYGLLKTAFGLATAALSEYLVKTALPKLGANIVSTVSGSTIFSTIGSFLTTKVAPLAVSAGQIFLAALAGLFIGGEVGKLIDNYIIGPMIEAFDGDKLTAEMYKNFHWFGEGGFFDQMWDGSEDFAGNVAVWADALRLMFEDLGQGISTAWANARTDTSGALALMQQDISDKWEQMKTDVSGALTLMGQDIVTGWDQMKADTSGALALMQQDLSDKWEQMKTDVSVALGLMKQDTHDKWEQMKTDIAGAMASIKQDIQSKWNDIKIDISSKASNIKQDVVSKWNETKQNVGTALNNMKTDATTAFNNIKTNVGSSIETMKQNAVTHWETMKSSAEEKFESIRSTVQSKIDEAGAYLKGLDWSSIGTDLIEGFFSGVKEKWEKVKEWVSDAAENLTRTVKDAFDINSPSKIWEQIGIFLDEGLEAGLQTGEKSLLSEAANLADGLSDRMTATSSFSFSDITDVEFLDVIRDKVSEISAIIDHIADAIASMGGLEIPDIAMGTIVPPKTKVGGTYYGSNGEEAQGDGYTDEATQLLRNIRDFLATLGSNQRGGDIKVVIDGRQVFKAVVDENNRAINRTGASPIRV